MGFLNEKFSVFSSCRQPILFVSSFIFVDRDFNSLKDIFESISFKSNIWCEKQIVLITKFDFEICSSILFVFILFELLNQEI